MFSTFKSKFFGGVSSVFGAKEERIRKDAAEKVLSPDSIRSPYEPSSAVLAAATNSNGLDFAKTLVGFSAAQGKNGLPDDPVSSDHYSLASLFISKDAIELCDVIGSGQFGDVFRGVYREKPVAIKVSSCDDLRSSTAEQREVAQKLVREAEAMGRLHHKHIIELIGLCCTEPVWLVMEFAPLGQLRSFLRSYKNELDRKSLFVYCAQIADALVYLAHCNILHRDIAARNVLVVDETLIKLADFGLSRSLVDESSYYKMSGGKLPIKWLAPESICYRRFTHASDVWMFAVCMWEIFKLGEKPFVNAKNADILPLLEKGERLPKPDSCPVRMYNLWTLCWSYEPSLRPKIEKVKQIVDSTYADECATNLPPATRPEKSPSGKIWDQPADVSARRGRLVPLSYNSATLQPSSTVHNLARSDDRLHASFPDTSAFKRRTLTLEEIKSYERQKKLLKELSRQIRQQLFDQTLHEHKLQSEEDDEWLDEQQRRFLSAAESDGNNSRQHSRSSPANNFDGLSTADRKRSLILSRLLSGSEARQAQISITAQTVTDLSRDIIRLTNDVCCGVNNEELFAAGEVENNEASPSSSTFSIIKTLGLSVASLSAHLDTLVDHISSVVSQLDVVPKCKPNPSFASSDTDGEDVERRVLPQLVTQIRDTQTNLLSSMKLVIEATTLAADVTNSFAADDAVDADTDSGRYLDNLATAVRLVAVDTRRILHLILKKNRLVDISS